MREHACGTGHYLHRGFRSPGTSPPSCSCAGRCGRTVCGADALVLQAPSSKAWGPALTPEETCASRRGSSGDRSPLRAGLRDLRPVTDPAGGLRSLPAVHTAGWDVQGRPKKKRASLFEADTALGGGRPPASESTALPSSTPRKRARGNTWGSPLGDHVRLREAGPCRPWDQAFSLKRYPTRR